MEVIENKGIPKIQRECWCCGSTVAFTRDDVESFTYRDIDGTMDCDTYVTCPVCGSKMNVSYQDERKLAYDRILHGKHIKKC